MRIGFVIVGAIVVIVGIALLYVPVSPQGSKTVSVLPELPNYLVVNESGASLTEKIPVSVTWTATTEVTVIAGACTSHCTNFSDLSDVTLETGTSGSFMVEQPVGGSVFMGANTSGAPSGSVTFKITAALTTVGSLLVIVGLLILVAGAFLRRTKASPAIAIVPAPGAPSPTPAPAAPSTPADSGPSGLSGLGRGPPNE